MNQSLYLTKFPQTQTMPNIVSKPVNQINKGASVGLWVAIIFGTILLGASFFLVWYYLLREKYIPPPTTESPSSTKSPSDLMNESIEEEEMKRVAEILTFSPCPPNKYRSDDAISVLTCSRCLKRQKILGDNIDCSKLSACKCKDI